MALFLVCSGTAQQFDPLGERKLPEDGDWTHALALGDVDGDGDLDLVCGNLLQQNRLYLNDGKGTFTDAAAAEMHHGDATVAVVLGDVDGDGDPDLVCGNIGGGPYGPWGRPQNRLYLNDGRGFFTDATGARMPTDLDDTRALALGDVDGDGDLDLVCGNVDQQNRLYLNDGRGFFTDATTTNTTGEQTQTHALALGDVDGDGDLDLVCGNLGQQNSLFVNDGKGNFTDATAARMPVDPDWTFALALGDVDGDGDPDLVCGNFRQNRLYLNDGQGLFTDATAARMPVYGGWTFALALGDVDGDGDADLICGNSPRPVIPLGCVGGQDRLYLNDGQGFFTDATATRMPTDWDMTFALVLGDVDGDGDPDLVSGNGDYPGPKPLFCGQLIRNRLYLNLLRQLDAPRIPILGATYRLDLWAKPGFAPSFTIALPVLAAGESRIPLPPYGTFGLDPRSMIELLPVYIPPPGGKVSVLLPVPRAPVLVGKRVFAQALMLDPLGTPRFTNVIADVILQ